MRVAVTGGSGFIGSHLIRHLSREGYEVILISRSARRQTPGVSDCVAWDELLARSAVLEGLDAIVSLSGETINQRWTPAAKRRILQSRVEAASRLAELVDRLERKPKVVIHGSGMSIYGTSRTDVYDETSPHRVVDFLSSVVEEWEKAADQIQGVRLVKLRIGLVLGKDGGAFPKMALPYKLGIGGRLGSGKQWFSWIHVEDMARAIAFCIRNESVEGPVNCTSPDPAVNDQFGRTLGSVLRRPHLFPVPSFVFKIMFGEMAVLLLEGQKVLPRKLLDHGFEFQFPGLRQALEDLV